MTHPGAPGQSANPYERYDGPQVDDDLIDPDDGRAHKTCPSVQIH